LPNPVRAFHIVGAFRETPLRSINTAKRIYDQQTAQHQINVINYQPSTPRSINTVKRIHDQQTVQRQCHQRLTQTIHDQFTWQTVPTKSDRHNADITNNHDQNQ
jgi:hypothetical protein